MTASFQAWWRALSLREKRLIVVMLALVAGVVVWLGIVRPVNDASAAAQAANLIAIDQAAQVSSGVAALRGDAPAASLDAPLDRVVGQSASDAGFTLDTNTAQGADMVSISIGSARAPALFAWLASLEARGIAVDALTVQPGANNLVSARATLRSGANA